MYAVYIPRKLRRYNLKKRNILYIVLTIVVLAIIGVLIWNYVSAPKSVAASKLQDDARAGIITAIDINNDEVV